MEGSTPISEELARSAESEAEFQHRLDAEKLEAMAEFAAGAGHEINNPLTVISGRAQLLLREETNPERQHALALISAQAMRVYEMIADMMLFARPPRPEFQPVEVARLIEEMGSGLISAKHPLSGSGKLDPTPFWPTICRTGQPGPIVVSADPAQLNVALRAICQNAIEALGSGGQITIDLQQSGGEVQICISDNGPGITPEERRHIFDPFYSARQAGRGLGLGLSKAWRIVTNHGGRIEVASQPGRGAAFTVILPIGPATS